MPKVVKIQPMRFLVQSGIFAALAFPSFAGTKLSGTTESIPRQTVNGGGGVSSGPTFILGKSFGETGVSSFTGFGFKMSAGLMGMLSQPGTITSITALSKSTGTLELAWTAPGADGFLGNVVGGSWRIDASSDPNHSFSPSTFLVEFATTVVAGSRQSYRLSGLSPNTTYYSRIYLADSAKVASETSAASAESTLANVPAAPLVTGVFQTSVTVTWTLPVGGASGFQLDGSSTNFGALLPGGLQPSALAGSSVSVTLTISGLTPYTVYFFKLGSLNWQKDVNFTTIVATRTLPGGPVPVEGLALAGDALNRRVLFTWSNPVFVNPAGVLIQVSSMPITQTVLNGTAYAPGTVLADGSVVRTTGAAVSHLETGLQLDTTQYFAFYSKDTANAYSVAVSTYVILDLPPMAPAGLLSELSADKTQVTLRWNKVTTNVDGSAFKDALSPSTWDISKFNVYRSTGLTHPTWVQVGTAAASAASFVASVPDPAGTYFYKVTALDYFGGETDFKMSVSNQGDIFVMAPDNISRLKIPASLASMIQTGDNPSGKPLIVKGSENASELGGTVVKSVSFDVFDENNKPVALRFPDKALDISLRYETAGGRVVASAMGLTEPEPGKRFSPLSTTVSPQAASQSLAAFWYNGREYMKLYGNVDTANQTVSLQSSMPGSYQIRSVAREEGVDFDLAGVSNKVITPNGDGLNDTVIFTFDNPKQSQATGKIFDIRGALVADMSAGPLGGGGSLKWDGKAGGTTVSRGVYIYQIEAEDKTFNGTVLVIR